MRSVVDLRKKSAGGGAPRWRLPLSQHEKPRSPLRARRRRTRFIAAFAALAALAISVFGISALSYNPRFVITEVEVTGAKATSSEDIQTLFEKELYAHAMPLISPANIFFIPRRDIERAIAAYFPRIQSVSVSREALLSQAVIVAVEERVPFARWCTPAEDTCYVLDERGYIFAPLGTSTNAFLTGYTFKGDVLIQPVGKTYMSGRFAGVLAVLEHFGQEGFTAHKVIADNEQDFSIQFNDGLIVRSSYGNGVDVVRNLKLVLASEALQGKRSSIEYVDLRFGNRVYYKLKGAAGESRVDQ